MLQNANNCLSKCNVVSLVTELKLNFVMQKTLFRDLVGSSQHVAKRRLINLCCCFSVLSQAKFGFLLSTENACQYCVLKLRTCCVSTLYSKKYGVHFNCSYIVPSLCCIPSICSVPS